MFNTLCWAKIEKVNTSVILYCLYHFREKRKVAASEVTDWIKGVLPWSGLSVACLFMRLTTF
jgi:hypothetical protein